jgi:MFS family permease
MTRPVANPGNAPPEQRHRFRRLPREIWVLGFVSLLMDSSSELVHSLLPMFMGTVLGASMLTIGMIEGVAEAAASITKVFSGALSDYFRKRKLLVVLGYGLGALTKPVFPLATSIGWVFGARFVDRIGKGIRGAPRDALVTELVLPEQRGAAFGLRQSLDSVGAFIGPLLAVLFMALLADNISAVLWVAVIPAFLAVLLLAIGVHEPDPAQDAAGGKRRLTFADAKLLSIRYWLVVALGAVFTLARFSEAFLVLRAQDVGLGMGYVPAIMIVMNLVYSALAYPAGIASDRFSPRILLVIGLVVLIASDLVLATAESPAAAFFGAGLWGVHMALTQGLLSKLVADTAPAKLRGTAFGVFNLVAGVMLLIASATAGALWNSFGASATFGAGALFASVAAIGLLLYRPR